MSTMIALFLSLVLALPAEPIDFEEACCGADSGSSEFLIR